MNLETIKILKEKVNQPAKPIIQKKERRSEEELIAAAQEKDKKMDRTRKTPTKQEKQQQLFEAMVNYQETPEEVPVVTKKSDDEWDVKIGDPIEYFDPELSYELTGYRPITADKGLDFDPKLFTKAADAYRQYGSYTPYVPGTFKHQTHWVEEFEKCKNGVTIGKYRITGEHYFFLNYYRLLSVLGDNKQEMREEDFPGFMAKQYEYFHYLELARKCGFDACIFKCRGVGYSEVIASNLSHAYTFHKASKSIISAAAQTYVDATLAKTWQELDFLNTCTQGGFKRLRQKIDTAMHKRASKVDKDRNESGWMSEIEGIVTDNPRKLRGARVYNLYFEECFDPDTLVIMSDYSRKKISDIKVGDFVMGIDGTPQEVISTCSGYDDMYKVSQQKGEDYIVNSKHKLYLEWRPRVYKYKDEIKLMTPSEYLAQSDYYRRTSYGLKSSGLEFGGELEIDPYYLGAWLGDGTSTSTEIIVNESDDPEIKDFLIDYFNTFPQPKHKVTRTPSSTLQYGKTKKQLFLHAVRGKGGPNQNDLLNTMHKYNLIRNKHIPKEVLFASTDYRLHVLAGLIDTDGNILKSSASYSFSYEIGMTREHLIDEIAELARSLGFYVYKSQKVIKQGYKVGGTVYRVEIRGDLSRIPVKVKRKQIPLDYTPTSNPLSTSIKVDQVGYGKYVGITLRPYGKSTDHLFLLNDYTIVHNCGSFPGLVDTYIQSRALVDILGYRIGMRISGGTGGDQGPQLAGLKRIFYNPEEFSVLPYRNRYTQSGEVQYTGFFIPSYEMWFGDAQNPGFDSRGVVYHERAKQHYIKKWSKIKDPTLLQKDKAEYCFTPEDAFVLEGSNNFDQEKLAEQKAAIEIHKTIPLPRQMQLRWQIKENQVDYDQRPTAQVGEGPIRFTEMPICDEHGIPFKNLYVIGVDGIDQGTNESSGQTDVSKFAIVVYRRQLGLQEPKIVAVYKERPRHIKDAWDICLKLAMFYNAKVLIEYTKISVVHHFKNVGKEHYLMHKPQGGQASGGRRTVNRQIGVTPTQAVIEHYLELIENYIVDYYQFIDYTDLLDELISYSYENKRKFDLVAAFGRQTCRIIQ